MPKEVQDVLSVRKKEYGLTLPRKLLPKKYKLYSPEQFDRETRHRAELQEFLCPHTHRCPGRTRRHLTVTSTINNRTINGTRQRQGEQWLKSTLPTTPVVS